jgi:hypothetical protein
MIRANELRGMLCQMERMRKSVLGVDPHVVGLNVKHRELCVALTFSRERAHREVTTSGDLGGHMPVGALIDLEAPDELRCSHGFIDIDTPIQHLTAWDQAIAWAKARRIDLETVDFVAIALQRTLSAPLGVGTRIPRSRRSGPRRSWRPEFGIRDHE